LRDQAVGVELLVALVFLLGTLVADLGTREPVLRVIEPHHVGNEPDAGNEIALADHLSGLQGDLLDDAGDARFFMAGPGAAPRRPRGRLGWLETPWSTA